MFDYAGNLKDACKISKDLRLESGGIQITERAESRFLADSTIEFTTESILTEFGTDTSGDAYYRNTKTEDGVLYNLQANGTFIRKKMDLKTYEKNKSVRLY